MNSRMLLIITAFLLSSCIFKRSIDNNGINVSDETAVDLKQDTFTIIKYESVPEEILEQVRFFGGGGGGPEHTAFCVDEQGLPLEYGENPKEIPIAENRESIYIITGEDDPIELRVKLPNGEIITDETTHSAYIYYIDIWAPEGQYVISFENKESEITCYFEVEKPSGPRLYPIYFGFWGSSSYGDIEDFEEKSKQLILKNFEPDEKVCLFAYHNDALFAAQSVNVDSNGNLLVYMEGLEEFYESGRKVLVATVGSLSGEVYPYGGNFFTQSIVQRIPEKIAVGEEHANIYDQPDKDSNVVAVAKQETELITFTGGKQLTFYGEIWWNVRLENGLVGWINNDDVSNVSKRNPDLCP